MHQIEISIGGIYGMSNTYIYYKHSKRIEFLICANDRTVYLLELIMSLTRSLNIGKYKNWAKLENEVQKQY